MCKLQSFLGIVTIDVSCFLCYCFSMLKAETPKGKSPGVSATFCVRGGKKKYMEIRNLSSKNIVLLNGTFLKPYEKKEVFKITKELEDQLSNLQNLGIISCN